MFLSLDLERQPYQHTLMELKEAQKISKPECQFNNLQETSHQIRATSFPTVKFICISAHILPFLLFQRRNWPYSYLKLVLTLQLITLSTLKRLCFCGYPIFHLHYLFFLLLIISTLETYKINPPLLIPFPPQATIPFFCSLSLQN